MATACIAAGATIEQVFACEYHQAFVKIEIEPFDKGLVFFGFSRGFLLHIEPKTPCFLLHPVLANLSGHSLSIPVRWQTR